MYWCKQTDVSSRLPLVVSVGLSVRTNCDVLNLWLPVEGSLYMFGVSTSSHPRPTYTVIVSYTSRSNCAKNHMQSNYHHLFQHKVETLPALYRTHHLPKSLSLLSFLSNLQPMGISEKSIAVFVCAFDQVLLQSFSNCPKVN